MSVGMWTVYRLRGKNGCGGRRVTGRIFGNDLLERSREDLPGKNFDILLNVARFGVWESHDDFEELFAVSFGLGHSHWSEAFEIAANTILLLDGEPDTHQRLKKVDGVHRSHIEFVLLLPPDATDADAARNSILRGDGAKVCVDCTAILAAFEFDQAAT